MSSATILDSQATLDIALSGVKLVEASAGTGKTYAIGNLYLRMLLGGYSVAEILVVTFTKAATEELRGRIRQRIADALQALENIQQSRSSHTDEFLRLWTGKLTDAGAQLARRQLKLALTSMDEAAIYTIHGFCQRALTEHAFNSQQAFDMEMISDDSLMWQEAIKDWWRINTYVMHKAELQAFTAAVGSLHTLIRLQTPLRKPYVKLTPACTVNLAEAMQQWQQLEAQFALLAEAWRSNREELEEILRSGGLKQNKAIYKPAGLTALLAVMDSYAASDDYMDFPEAMRNLAVTTLAQALNKKGQNDDAFRHGFFVDVERVLDAEAAVSAQIRLSALHDASCFAREHVARIKQQSGQMAFDDQLVLLERALAHSAALAQAIRKRFPVAMIDEFQDTDAVQYGIFQHIYQSDADAACSLIMIGDPKQAIYSFRGGDIFAYIKAKQDADDHYTLDTNWRSSPGLIRAVNHLFSLRADAFIYADIPFEAVKACDKAAPLLCRGGREVTPLTVWQLPLDANGKAMRKSDLIPLLHAQTANEIVRLLADSRKGQLTLAGKPVEPGDIAVLVRGHAEASGLREALGERGIAAVAAGRNHVFESDEASGLKSLLAAVVDCKDASLLRQALASSLLGMSYGDIHQSVHSDQQWLEWTVRVDELHQTWARRGFMPMFQQMQRMLGVGEHLAYAGRGERRLTNLLHLGELLQQATQSISGMEALLVWFEQQLSDASSTEDTELRLENDAALVSIVTIHSSKGLEYPIVFLPYMWSCRPHRHSADLLPYYDEAAGCRCFDAAENNAHLWQAEKERLAEDVRLSYVALTRACSKVYMAWGNASFKVGSYYDSGSTALGWLLHHGQQVEDLAAATPRAFRAGGAEVAAELRAIADASEHSIAVQELSSLLPEMVCLAAEGEEVAELKPAGFKAKLSENWRISSFTGLTRDVHQLVSPPKQVESADAIFHVPAGSQTGLFLHALFEQLDFQACDIDAFVQHFSMRNAVRYGLEAEHYSSIQGWVSECLHTALNADGLRLADIAVAQRLNELPFDFSLRCMDIPCLNQMLEQYAGRVLQPIQEHHNYSGYMTGIIDLVFEHEGQYYLADYKSNHLGYTLDAYAPELLQQAVYDRRYDLQYLIYTLALHRYLKLRLPDYDYDQHIGGVYYLFLRGMRRASGTEYGVFYDKPEQALIEALDTQVFHAERAS